MAAWLQSTHYDRQQRKHVLYAFFLTVSMTAYAVIENVQNVLSSKIGDK